MENRKKNEFNNFNLESIINTTSDKELSIENQNDLNPSQDDDENIQINVDDDDSLHSNADIDNSFKHKYKRSFEPNQQIELLGSKKFCNYNQSLSSVSTNSSLDHSNNPSTSAYQTSLDNQDAAKLNLIESSSENQKINNEICYDDNDNDTSHSNKININNYNQIANFYENLSENGIKTSLESVTASQHLTNILKAYQPLIKQRHTMPLNLSLSPPQISNQSPTEIKLPFIIDYFFIVHTISENRETVKGKCKFCSYEFNCKMKPTSNFSKHAQIHEKLFAEYLIAKENIKLKKATELSSAAASSSIFSSNRKSINQKKTSQQQQHLKQNKDSNSIKLENHQQSQFNLSFHHSNSIISSSSSTSSSLFSSTLKSDMSNTHYHQSCKLSNNKLPLINNKYMSSSPNNTSQFKHTIENKIGKFLINSLLPSTILETKTFNDLVSESFDSYQNQKADKLIQLKYTSQLIPNFVEMTEKRIQDLINNFLNASNDTFCTITIDLFNDYFSFININDFGLNELISMQESNLNPINNNLCLFIGYSINILNQNWSSINQTLGCLKLTPSCLKNLTYNDYISNKNNSIESLIYTKFADLCKKFNIKSEKIYKIIMNNQSKSTLNMWQKFKYWSLPGLELLNEQFFDIDLDMTCLTNLINTQDENNEINDFEDEQINIYDEFDSNNFSKETIFSEKINSSVTDKDPNVENSYNSFTSTTTAKKNQNFNSNISDFNKLIERTNKIDFFGTDDNYRTPCVIDTLNTCVEEIMIYLIESNNFILTVLKKISKLFYLATCSQSKSKLLMTNVYKIRNSSYSTSLPRWCQQFLLIKRIFKIDNNDIFKSSNFNKRNHQRSPYLDGSSFQQTDSHSKWSAKLSNKEYLLLKEFVSLLEPIYLMLIELLPSDLECNVNDQNEFQNNSSNTNKFSKSISDSYNFNHNRNSKVSKALPCFKTLIFSYQNLNTTSNGFNEATKKIQQIFSNQFDFISKDPTFKLASLLDPNFGTSFVPSIEKKQYEHFLIESIILNEEIFNQNQQISCCSPIPSPPNNDSLDLYKNKYRYIYYDEKYIDDQKNNLNLYREEVASYLKHIRLNFNMSNKTSTSNSAFSLINNHYDNNDPYKFWSINFKKWPYLARLAKKVFTVHVSNNGVERILNLEKNQFLSNHNDLKIIENILFLKSNQNLF